MSLRLWIPIALAACAAADAFGAAAPRMPPWDAAVSSLYAAPDARLLWFAAGKPTAAASALIAELQRADERGLVPEDYAARELADRIAAATRAGAAALDGAQQRELDRRLSLAVARFVSDLHAGRVAPRDVGHDLDVPHAALDLTVALRALANASDVRAVLADFEPGFVRYDLLKKSLQQYRALAATPQLTELPPLGRRALKPGDTWEGVPALRRLLRALGDWRGATDDVADDATVFDAPLSAALQQFQYRHGLPQDGVLGRTTYAELTRPLAQRVRQIELSLERARWLPPRLDTPPIIVN
ncbi:MAG: peptidoglycan-binding protein, partial [Steroidobacteraceae bacterium]|nr:peptidoglycan-binding protein [Steroidobacteraceae bacterium]MDW8259713.1 peptidoglycan-binding protein [Gammaproteobacteria bacterium]